jgi:hypothetical protein
MLLYVAGGVEIISSRNYAQFIFTFDIDSIDPRTKILVEYDIPEDPDAVNTILRLIKRGVRFGMQIIHSKTLNLSTNITVLTPKLVERKSLEEFYDAYIRFILKLIVEYYPPQPRTLSNLAMRRINTFPRDESVTTWINDNLPPSEARMIERRRSMFPEESYYYD